MSEGIRNRQIDDTAVGDIKAPDTMSKTWWWIMI
jgi:hypothetical protein